MATPRCPPTHTEGETVPLQTDIAENSGVRAARRHLLKVHIAAVCKVQLCLFIYDASSPLPFTVSVIEALVISPGPVAGKVFEQVFAHIFVLRPDEAEAEQKGAEGEGGISLISVFLTSVFFWLMACAEMARARVIYARTLPAWRVLSKQRHSQCTPVEHRMKVQGVVPGPVRSAHGCHRSLDTIPD